MTETLTISRHPHPPIQPGDYLLIGNDVVVRIIDVQGRTLTVERFRFPWYARLRMRLRRWARAMRRA